MFHILTLCLLFIDAAHAQSAPGTGSIDADAPAAEPEPASIWDYIEGADGSPPTSQELAATQELAAERFAEVSFIGLIGAEPPLDFYRDPLKATNVDPFHLDKIDPKEFDIPIVVNDWVKKWMTYFLGPGRKYYTRYLERSTKWLPLMYREIDARGLPRDLTYLSMIESGFSTHAYSYAAAVGLWQFMSGTGRDYDLRIDSWVDERRDPELATAAALEYLSDLHKMFDGNWWLAWASYNGGQGRVMSTVKRYGTTDFWKIVEYDALHPETENYVPKLIAAAIIGKHPERYGFVGLDYQPEFTFDTVEVPAATSVDVLARCAGITDEQFQEYNPALRQYALPADPATQKIRIPRGRAESFKQALAKVPPTVRASYTRHTVKRGESLASIAQKYKVSVDDIVRVNRIQNANKIVVGMELNIPVAGGTLTSTTSSPPASTSTTSSASTAKTTTTTTKTTTHTVQSGETLAGIGARYGVTVDQLKSWNNLQDANNIQVGQKLSVQSTSSTSSTSAATTTTTPTYYTVRSGDTLSGIASKYGTTVDQLKSWNSLSSSTIVVGQKLVVKGGSSRATTSSTSSSSYTTYTVKNGDTLSAIADRYDCSVTDIKNWNGLSSSTIYPGQKLKIKK